MGFIAELYDILEEIFLLLKVRKITCKKMGVYLLGTLNPACFFLVLLFY